jgi:hypothetical protein
MVFSPRNLTLTKGSYSAVYWHGERPSGEQKEIKATHKLEGNIESASPEEILQTLRSILEEVSSFCFPFLRSGQRRQPFFFFLFFFLFLCAVDPLFLFLCSSFAFFFLR